MSWRPSEQMDAPQRRRKSFVIGLALSIALNVFLVGVIGAHLLHSGREPPRVSPIDKMLTRAHDNLSPEDAVTMQRIIEQSRPDLMRYEQETREAHARASAILRTEPFDAAAYVAALGDFRSHRRAFEAQMEQSFVAAAQAISPDGRRRLADMRGY